MCIFVLGDRLCILVRDWLLNLELKALRGHTIDSLGSRGFERVGIIIRAVAKIVLNADGRITDAQELGDGSAQAAEPTLDENVATTRHLSQVL